MGVQLLQSSLLAAVAYTPLAGNDQVPGAMISQPLCQSHAKAAQSTSDDVAPVISASKERHAA